MILEFNDKEEWFRVLKEFKKRDIYFDHRYYQMHRDYGDGEPKCLVVDHKGKKILYPFLMNSINQLGYKLDNQYYDIQGVYGYNGPLYDSFDKDLINAFKSELNEYCNSNNIIAEFTRFHPLLNNHLGTDNYYNVIVDRKTASVNLQNNYSDVKKSFSSSTRRNIKKAENNNLAVCVHKGSYPLKKEFIELYLHTMERVNSNKYLKFNEKYFSTLFTEVKPIQFTVKYENKVIASSIVLYGNEFLHYHLGASHTEYLEYRPNDFLFDKMIKYGIDNNFKKLHLGGGNTSSSNDGLLRFKKGFSNESLNEFCIGKKIYSDKVYKNVIRQFKKENPDKYVRLSNKLLCYREIEA